MKLLLIMLVVIGLSGCATPTTKTALDVSSEYIAYTQLDDTYKDVPNIYQGFKANLSEADRLIIETEWKRLSNQVELVTTHDKLVIYTMLSSIDASFNRIEPVLMRNLEVLPPDAIRGMMLFKANLPKLMLAQSGRRTEMVDKGDDRVGQMIGLLTTAGSLIRVLGGV